jgi:hypothetical protein
MTKPTRRKRSTTRKLPGCIGLADVTAIMSWPLGKVKTNMCAGEGWTDCVIELDAAYRLGGKYNTRRVRYDGVFYVTVNRRRVAMDGALQRAVLDVASHVYGVSREEDVAHNKVLKGY